MSENTKIEWCDHTFNPWEGCQKVGPGCDNCYAESRNARFACGQAINWGPGAPRRRTSASNWKKPLAWNANADAFMAAHGRRQRVFCASLADVFDNAVDPQWRADLFTLIQATPNLDWLLLTKRIGNVVPMLAELRHGNDPDLPVLDMMPLPNVWIGVTIVNQEEADRDITKLIEVPAAKRFLSVEPMLGELDIMKWLQPYTCADCSHHGSVNDCGPDGCEKCGEEAAFDSGYTCKACGADDQSARASCPNCGSHHSYGEDSGFIWSSEQRLIDWVICGGESGPGARPMHPDWARSLRDQCQAAGVPFLFKQWGEWTPGENVVRQRGTVATAKWWKDAWSFHEENLASTDGHIDDEPDLYRVGKKTSGRLLDGRTWDEFPTSVPIDPVTMYYGSPDCKSHAFPPSGRTEIEE